MEMTIDSKTKRKEIESQIKEILSSEEINYKNDYAKVKALLIIHNFQTIDEQRSCNTIENNGIGFSGYDGVILSAFAQQVKDKGYLTEKQMQVVRNRIKKYWKQISAVALSGSTPKHIVYHMNNWKENYLAYHKK